MKLIEKVFSEFNIEEKLISFYLEEIIKSKKEFCFFISNNCLTGYQMFVNNKYVNSNTIDDNNPTNYATFNSFFLYLDEIKSLIENEKNFSISFVDNIMEDDSELCDFLDRFLLNFTDLEVEKLMNHIEVNIFTGSSYLINLKEKYPDVCKKLKMYNVEIEPHFIKRISDLFQNSYYLTGTPNALFDSLWNIQEEDNKELYNVLKQKIESDKDISSNLNSYVLYTFETPKSMLFGDIIEYNCIRCYIMPTSKIIFAPFVVLKQLTDKELDEIYEILLNSPYKQLIKDFLCNIAKTNNDDKQLLKYKYLNKLLNDIYGCQFLTEMCSNNDINWDITINNHETLKIIYGKDYYNINDLFHIYNKISKDQEELFSIKNDTNISNISVSGNMVDLLFQYFESVFDINTDIELFIDNFFAFIYEKKASPDITYQFLKYYLEKNEIKINLSSFYGYLLYCIEHGQLDIFVDKVENHYTYVLRYGKQAYRLLTEDNQWAIRDLANIESVFISLCAQDLVFPYSMRYVNCLLNDELIDKKDYDLLKYLIESIEKERLDIQHIKFIHSINQPRRKYIRDYYVERDEVQPNQEYDKNLKRVYDKVMIYKK